MGYTRRVSKFELSTIILTSPFWRGTKSRTSLMKKSWDELWDISQNMIDLENERNAKAQSLPELSVEVGGGVIVATIMKDSEITARNTGISIKFIPNDPKAIQSEVYINHPVFGRMTVMVDVPDTTLFSYPK